MRTFVHFLIFMALASCSTNIWFVAQAIEHLATK